MSTKTIIITGGTGKLGKQFVRFFFKKSYNVVFTSRSKSNIESMLNEHRNDPGKGKIYGIQVNLEEEDAVLNIMNYLREHELRPDCLINNARNRDHLLKNKDGMPSREQWVGEFLLNVMVPFELSMALANEKGSNLKSIINVSSMYGVVPPNPHLYEKQADMVPVHYGTTKAALIHLTKELSVRLAPRGIKVNAISYGGVRGRVDSRFEQRYARFCPLGRMLEEEEVVGAVDFLASDFSNGITGHNLVVDGGWTVW